MASCAGAFLNMHILDPCPILFANRYGWPRKRSAWRKITSSTDWCTHCLYPGPGLQLLGFQFPKPGAAGRPGPQKEWVLFSEPIFYELLCQKFRLVQTMSFAQIHLSMQVFWQEPATRQDWTLDRSLGHTNSYLDSI